MPAPRSTYRLQFNPQLAPPFDFEAASKIAPYLRDLGISHAYCSPYLQPAAGSTHGYDCVDYHSVNREIGGANGLAEFEKALGENHLGQVLDIVPNHMAIGKENAWWWDTLENGAASRYAPYFDIEWNAPEERLRNKILLPLLGDHYGLVLAAGDLKLERQGALFVIRYHERAFPVAPESIAGILSDAAQNTSAPLGFLADALSRLPAPTLSDWSSRIARHRDKEVVRDLLARLIREDPEVGPALDRVVAQTNENLDRLDALLSEQNYRLSRWRTAERELVYRRFFDINTLVGMRVEDERVFEDMHVLILKWLKNGDLDGVRVDHPDGLRDPAQYFDRLRQAAPQAWIVAEKILQPGEHLPASWPIAGSTGYDFLNIAGGLFVDPQGQAPLNELYRGFTSETVDFSAVAREKRTLILREVLGSDLNRLTALFLQICEDHREHRDYTRHEIHEALREVIASFPVYRTYIRANTGVVSDSDREYVSAAVDDAKQIRPDLEARLFDFVRDVLLLQVRGATETEFVMRFQQVTAAAMAKGVEDTAFYCYARLISLNEVGGDPSRFGTTVDEFHRWCAETQDHYPQTLLATSTHDTKRSEDVRARIHVLSEIPGEWAEAVRKWSTDHARFQTGDLPDRKTQYLLYQTLVGAWPISKDRIQAYMHKAVREAKEHTSWIAPDPAYERALEKFIDSVLDDPEFSSSLETLLARIVPAARVYSLATTLLKLTAPGIPDIYQGCEIWDFSLVDPDNRRAVDYDLRRRLLAELDRLCPDQILARADEGLPKLWLIRQALRTRNSRPENFGPEGAYTAVWASGPAAAHVIAFQRGNDVMTIAPRLSVNLSTWESTTIEIPSGAWRNQLSGELLHGGKQELAALFANFPVALLTRESAA
jgi:(1->4)-alpha-D-glucan 1-alpha-D-glucosylmutase